MHPRSGFRSGGTSERTLVPAFRSGETSERTLVPVFVLGEHPSKPPFWKPPFWVPPIFELLKLDILVPTYHRNREHYRPN